MVKNTDKVTQAEIASRPYSIANVKEVGLINCLSTITRVPAMRSPYVFVISTSFWSA